MSFADDVRKNYKPNPEPPQKSFSEIRDECARILVEDAKRNLMHKSSNGITQEISVGFFGKKVRAISCEYHFYVYKLNKLSIMYSLDEHTGEPTTVLGLDASSESDAHAVLSVIQQLCNKEGIHVDRYASPRSTTKDMLRFWVEV